MDVDGVTIFNLQEGYQVVGTVIDASSNVPEILISKIFCNINDAKTLTIAITNLLLEHHPHMKETVTKVTSLIINAHLHVGECVSYEFESGFIPVSK